ncbi:MAG: ion transporter [Limnohabitans sp.]|nr:ion transporter [Burkholderiales bacterium]
MLKRIAKKLNMVGALISSIRFFIRKNKGRTFRQKVFSLLHPTPTSGPLHRYIDMVIIAAVLVSVVSIVLETVPFIHAIFEAEFALLEIFTVALFSVEYIGRVYSSCESPPYAGPVKGRLKYMGSIPALIDLVAILPYFLGILLHQVVDTRFLRIFRLSRLLKVTRYTGTLNTLIKAINREKRVLMASAFMMLLMVILTASLGYELEHDAQPDKFDTIPSAMYWAVITLASVGYGDISPITPLGRAMTVVISLIGIGIFAIPAGLMASAFTDQLRIDRETFENEFRERLAKGQISQTDHHALNAEAERLHLTAQDVTRIMDKVKHEMKLKGQQGLENLKGVELLEHYRQQISQLRSFAQSPQADALTPMLQDTETTTTAEREVWQALRK